MKNLNEIPYPLFQKIERDANACCIVRKHLELGADYSTQECMFELVERLLEAKEALTNTIVELEMRSGPVPPMPKVKKPCVDIKEYMMGQRVIFEGVICTVVPREHVVDEDWIWIDNPKRKYKHAVSRDNIKPLPGGQL